jgi:hypothetical protein
VAVDEGNSFIESGRKVQRMAQTGALVRHVERRANVSSLVHALHLDRIP